MGSRFRLLDHTADVGLEIEADTLDELFTAAARGLADLLVDGVEPEGAKELALAADAVDLLLHRWLSELLFLFEVERWVAAEVAVKVDTSSPVARLHARMFGGTFDPARHRSKLAIKAVTYHALLVEQRAPAAGEAGPAAEWHARVIFDI